MHASTKREGGGGGEMTWEASKWYLMSLTMPAILFLVLFWTSSAK